ncbi:formate hydrogenlyase subunit 3/multisubunit Na+/H+ antiporter, MnhD subunit [Thioflavicoccus mobilis 8321]|uniref:Formate hydrogenlyase subunit 3/multisubunit Na+/H+ antiporter, MnhD subunit n=1 Tax=Thioflavicoccus mobilis 8321 TaxID=765912 RepID=L0GYM8_9GAMM|nr:hydrogenase 4 subunit B [Thioflavicoccus mobilis]AGA91883.1 formate hydrogenlyase subunit 3/multisubunit Na+/H+ antiporter, MnhD subunit [Thioflavicoccus mobilis 8321]
MTPPDPLPLAGLAIALALLSALVSLATARRPALLRILGMPLLAAAGGAALASGGAALVADGAATAELPLGLPWLPWHLRLDALAGLFLILIGGVTTAVGVYGIGYVRGLEHGRDPLPVLGGFTGLFLAGMLLVVLADDAFVFMIAWETMSLASYFLVAFHHEQPANRRAAFLYLLMAHLSGLAILLGFGVLAAFAGSFDFAALRATALAGPWASLAFALALLGFGLKAGLVPLHAWLPEAHPAAPSHVSALMSAVMLKVAVYGFIRFVFDLLGPPQWQWGVVVLALGSGSALMGILYALVQTDLKRLLAYSSVENLGVIFVALGLALLFLATGHALPGALALVAALYHTLNHALFKGLLFLGAGAILHGTHERDLEQMGGLLRRMPWTGWFFLIGSLSIAALPPFNGFVSEWLTFQVALQAWQLDSGVLRSLIPIVAAVLALTAALVAACFVKAFGTAFLGQARSRHVRRARPTPLSMRIGQGLLALACLALGVLPTGVIALLEPIPRELLGQGVAQATALGWLWLTPVSPAAASYSAPLVLLVLAVLVAVVFWSRQWGAVGRLRRCDPWDCGFAPPSARMQYGATAFAQPLRRVFGLLFRVEETVETLEDGRRRYRLAIADRAWGLLYLPVARAVETAARRVTRLQSGNVRVYLGWTLATLLVLLWLIS